jgi:biotin operon repressor
VIEFKLPKRPKIIEKQAPPDQRKFAVVPMRAALDTELHGFSIKVLVLLCSYANRAGITWVGQQRIAEHLQVSKQQVARSMKQLRDRGHIEVMSKGFRGERANTTRVIYDPEIKANDAIAITSGQEDTRPPETRRRQTKEMTRSVTNAPKTVTNSSDLPDQEPEFTEEQMAANRKRLKEMLGGLAGRDGFHYNRPERIGDIMARKPKAKPTPKTPHIDNTQVVNEEAHIDNIIDNTGVVQTKKNIGYEEVLSIYEDISKHRFSNVRTTRIDEVDLRCAAIMCEVGVSRQKFIDACQTMPVCLRLSEVCEQLAGEATGF